MGWCASGPFTILQRFNEHSLPALFNKMKLIDALVSVNYSWKISNVSGCSISKQGSSNYYTIKGNDDTVITSYPDLENCLKYTMRMFPQEFMGDGWYVSQ